MCSAYMCSDVLRFEVYFILFVMELVMYTSINKSYQYRNELGGDCASYVVHVYVGLG